jgi:hypothetical protein
VDDQTDDVNDRTDDVDDQTDDVDDRTDAAPPAAVLLWALWAAASFYGSSAAAVLQ